MRIFLTGFMGAGKTFLGQQLAEYISLPFIDLDRYIEQKAGVSIAELFESGEDDFRKLEAVSLREMKEVDNGVIATGGGTPCFYDNMQWIKKQGTSVYIREQAMVLGNRLKSGKSQRPLIKGISDKEMSSFLQKKLGEREYFYLQADFVIPNSIKVLKKLADENGWG